MALEKIKKRFGVVKKRFGVVKTVKALINFAILLTAISSLIMLISPLLPSQKEYVGSFPMNLWDNLVKWISVTLPRHIVLFHEYYPLHLILSFASRLLLLLLLHNISNAISRTNMEQKGGEELIDDYFN